MQVISAILLPVRVVLVLMCTLLGLTVQLALFWWVSPQAARRVVALWSHTMLVCLGVSLRIQNADSSYTQQTVLVVSNHVSWLDILALQAATPVVFVAKSEIKSWPVLGWMVSLAGTCFIDRSRRTALRTVHSTLTAHLQKGQNVCIFPEGTTTDGTQVLPFHAGLMQAAIEAKVSVQPIRLQYSHIAAAYIGDLTLLTSLGNILLTPHLSVTVQTLPTLDFQGATRQTLALQAHAAIEAAAPIALPIS
jgi:1-acyl-sn-glycerol-3-phosphate acyltransferase